MTNTNPTDSHSAAVSLSDHDAVQQILSTTVFNLWDIANNLTRITPIKHDRYRVTIFGSARAQPGSFVYEEVKRVATALAEMDCDIITGGGPGLMQAANEGATAIGDPARNKSIGIRVQLPFEQEVNAFVEQAFEHRTFFTRLHHFVLTSDAYVVVPGGIGTVLELTMIWQLLQVKHLQNTPLVLVGKMWSEFVALREIKLAFSAIALGERRRSRHSHLRQHRRRSDRAIAKAPSSVAGRELISFFFRCIAPHRGILCQRKNKPTNLEK